MNAATWTWSHTKTERALQVANPAKRQTMTNILQQLYIALRCNDFGVVQKLFLPHPKLELLYNFCKMYYVITTCQKNGAANATNVRVWTTPDTTTQSVFFIRNCCESKFVPIKQLSKKRFGISATFQTHREHHIHIQTYSNAENHQIKTHCSSFFLSVRFWSMFEIIVRVNVKIVGSEVGCEKYQRLMLNVKKPRVKSATIVCNLQTVLLAISQSLTDNNMKDTALRFGDFWVIQSWVLYPLGVWKSSWKS